MMFALITLKTTIRRNDHCKGAQRAGLKLVEALQNHHTITEFRIRAKDSRIPFFRVGGHRGELRNRPIRDKLAFPLADVPCINVLAPPQSARTNSCQGFDDCY